VALIEGLQGPLRALADRFVTDGLCDSPPNQVLACEYFQGDSCGQHIDRTDLFGDTVLALSLGRPETLILKNRTPYGVPAEIHRVLLEPHSLYVLRGAARYDWTHGIRSKKPRDDARADSDRVARFALTFRTSLRES
jgi:alkylated DNA repair dioxygenase AlkB